MQASQATEVPSSRSCARLDSEERKLLLRSFTVCVGLPVLLVFASASVASQVLSLLVRCLLFGLPAYLLVLGIYTWTQSDEPLSRLLPRVLLPHLPVDALWSDAGLHRIPVVTLGLILTNVAVYYGFPDPQVYAFPLDDPDLWLWSSLTSIFLHADPGHLWGNMFFFWVFGSAVEARLPGARYLTYYLLFGVASSLYSGCAYVLADQVWGWSLGASGAISGVAGLFIVRCYFSRISIGLPILGPLGFGLPVQMRARVNAMLWLTIFFLSDLLGIRETLDHGSTDVNHWAHVGGYGLGLAVAYGTGLSQAGLREALARNATEEHPDGDYGATDSAATDLLRLEPGHAGGLLARARRRSRYEYTNEAQRDYLEAIRIVSGQDRREAAKIFLEYFRKYHSPLAAAEQITLTPAIESIGEADTAAQALELVIDTAEIDPEARQKALLYEARLLLELDLDHAAIHVYERFLREYSGVPGAGVVREKLLKLRGPAPDLP